MVNLKNLRIIKQKKVKTMKRRGYLIGAVAAGALLFSLNTNVQAATVPISDNATSYVRKGNQYRFYFKVPTRLTVATKAKYKILNTSNWECIPYKGKNKNTKVFYLRSGHYNLTTKSGKNVKIKTSATRITKIRNKLETFSHKTYPLETRFTSAIPIKIGQTVTGMTDMYHTEKLNTMNRYKFTLDKDQKVTMNMSVQPVYENSRSNIFNNNDIQIVQDTDYGYALNPWKTKGTLKNGKYSWNLEKGTYYLEKGSARGRFSFKLTSEDTNALPSTPKLTKVSSTEDGIKVDYTKADNATGYGIYGSSLRRYRSNDPLLDAASMIGHSNFTPDGNYPDVLTQTISKNRLINGETYDIAVRAVNDEEGRSFSPVSANQKFTYYIPLKGSHEKPKTPTLKVSYYNDHGSDEPYINIEWDVNPEADSYEIQYRLKGSSKWATFFSKTRSGDIVDDPTNDFGQDFKKGQVYEVRVRALHSNLISDWSEVKTARVDVTPNR